MSDSLIAGIQIGAPITGIRQMTTKTFGFCLAATTATIIQLFLAPNRAYSQNQTDATAKEIIQVEPQAQLLAYRLNWIRLDPVRYQNGFNLSVDLSNAKPRQPLAINYSLMAAAQIRSDEMAKHNYFSHQSNITRKWPNEIAEEAGFVLPRFFGKKKNSIESISGGTRFKDSADSLKQLIVDRGINPPAHRHHLLGMTDFYSKGNEIGVGIAFNKRSQLGYYWTIHATFRDPQMRFLTGVVFQDKNRNGIYDLKEGIAGMEILVDDRVVAISNSAGGWVAQVSPGKHSVSLKGNNQISASKTTVSVTDQNIQVDFEAKGTAFVNFNKSETP